MTAIAFCICAVLALPPPLKAQESELPQPGAHAALLEVDDAIGPAIHDYLRRSLDEASEAGASIAIIRLDTPGGLVTTTREIIRLILDSPVPVAVYVAPEGARAASAGTYMVYAAHVAAMAPATHLGAATPVQMGGGSSPLSPGGSERDGGSENEGRGSSQSESEDQEGKSPPQSEGGQGDAMSRKLTSDAAAYLRSLAELRGRNAEWAEKSVREGASLTANEAVEQRVIDLLAPDINSLLEAMDGMTITARSQEITLSTAELAVREMQPDWRTELLSIIANPNVAYILMMLGIYGLIFEFSNPGSFVPGIAGAILLLLGLFALQQLPINYAGLALIILGIALMAAEAFAPSFGALGIGGVIAFAIGSVLLIDTDVPAFEISWPIIAAFSAASAAMCIFVLALALKAWKRPVVSGREGIAGSTAVAMEDFDNEGRVRLQGESWKAHTKAPVSKGDSVKVLDVGNLKLEVEPKEKSVN